MNDNCYAGRVFAAEIKALLAGRPSTVEAAGSSVQHRTPPSSLSAYSHPSTPANPSGACTTRPTNGSNNVAVSSADTWRVSRTTFITATDTDLGPLCLLLLNTLQGLAYAVRASLTAGGCPQDACDYSAAHPTHTSCLEHRKLVYPAPPG